MKKADAFELTDAVANKALSTSYKDDPESGVIKRTVIGNTYNWLDSHDDVHIDGIFSKSISERQGSILHLHDHEYKTTSEVGDVEAVYEKPVEWKDLGVNHPGRTKALFMDSEIRKDYVPQVYLKYLKNKIQQHSVGMQYVKLDLAVNDPEMKAEFAEWNKHINGIGNKEKAIEQGFFWAVKEAKLVEISAVLAGSNELTPTVHNDVDKTDTVVVEMINPWDKLAHEFRRA
jgi:hypothetical protein